MNTPASLSHRQQRVHAFAAEGPQSTLEWEELPSLARSVRRSEFTNSKSPVWNPTTPMDLPPPVQAVAVAAPAPAPFREVLDGLHVREIPGGEVFDHFFGQH